MTIDSRPHNLAGCRRRHGDVGPAAGRPCQPDCVCHCHEHIPPDWTTSEWRGDRSAGELLDDIKRAAYEHKQREMEADRG